MIVSALIVILAVLGLYAASHKLSGAQAIATIALVGAGIALVASPALAQWAAMRLGVGRGTDLLLYAAVVGGLFAAAHFYFRFKRQEAQIVMLVRALALGAERAN